MIILSNYQDVAREHYDLENSSPLLLGRDLRDNATWVQAILRTHAAQGAHHVAPVAAPSQGQGAAPQGGPPVRLEPGTAPGPVANPVPEEPEEEVCHCRRVVLL